MATGLCEDDVSLRPLNFKGSTANPFSVFGKGLGFANRGKMTSLVTQSYAEPTKRTGERIKYAKEFLVKFMNVYTTCPAEVTQLNIADILVSGDDQKEAHKEALARVAEDIDDRDWRTRMPDSRDRDFDFSEREAPRARDAEPSDTSRDQRSTSRPAPTPAASAAPSAPADAAAPRQAAPSSGGAEPASGAAASSGSTIVRAEEMGRTAYRVGATLSAEERAIRSVKGILNKLTPEKFERLLKQLLEVITTADVLKAAISLVFESAVEQPTYCAMYADLCVHLSRELPSFPPPQGADKPISFKQILLNTCQDEFEGAEELREKAGEMSDSSEREDAERAVKKRVLGNMRLICELYKQDMVKDWILITCVDELLMARTKKGDKLPPEANIEAVCEIFTLGGGRLSKSDRPETVKKVERTLRELERLQAERGIASRIRFLIRDVLELKRSNWIPRRETNTVKTIEEIRSQAEAELGMVSSTIAASLALPSLALPTQRFDATPSGQAEFELIPPLRSGDAAGPMDLFPPLRSQAQGPAGHSALLGTWTQPVAPAARQQVAAAPSALPTPSPAASQQAAQPVRPRDGQELSEEDLKRKAVSLYQEFCSTLDTKEALTCIQELHSASKARVLELGIEAIMESIKDKEQDALRGLLLAAVAGSVVSAADLSAAITTFTSQLEDLAMDVPKAPQLIGQLYGAAVAQGFLGLDLLPTLLEGEMSVDPKRRFAAAALRGVKAAKSEDWLREQCTSAGLHAASFLDADPEFDSDAAPLADFLKAEGLSCVPV